MKSTAAPFLLVLCLIAVVAACQGRRDETRDDAPPSSRTPQTSTTSQTARDIAGGRSPFTLNDLKNMTYTGFEEPSSPIALADGHWEGGPVAPGSATRPTVNFVRDFRRIGDLDDRDPEEAIVLLGENTGGSGYLVYMAVVAVREGRPENVATTFLGDRTQVRTARIENERIILDVIKTGQQDPACCPGDLATWTYALEGGQLTRVSSEETGRFSLESLHGEDYVLRWWNWTEPVPSGLEITLTFEDGHFVGRSSCNRYFAAAAEGRTPGAVAVKPAATTNMACSKEMMATERRYLSLLNITNNYGFMAGELALSYRTGDRWGVMLFEPRVPVGRVE